AKGEAGIRDPRDGRSETRPRDGGFGSEGGCGILLLPCNTDTPVAAGAPPAGDGDVARMLCRCGSNAGPCAFTAAAAAAGACLTELRLGPSGDAMPRTTSSS
ncbi:hypothetical protein Vretimale_8380, partial [Volvox reticuliferus]